MQQFNPIDAAMLFMERAATPFHVSFVSIYDPSTCPGRPPTFDDIVEAIDKCLPKVDTFRRKIVRVPFDIDYPYWIEDEDFDLQFHMRHLALPKPGDWAQFRNQVGRLIARPLDLSRSPWEMNIIEGLDNLEGMPAGCFATVLKVHHCAIDGQTGVALINALHSDNPKKKLRRVRDDWQPEPVPSDRELLRRATRKGLRRPLVMARLVLSNARALASSAFREIRSSDDDRSLSAPETIFSGEISPHRTFNSVLCPLDDLKQVRRAVEGATINDVCLTVVAEGMRRYLKAKRALPKESLVTVVPISTRTPEQAAGGGNQLTITRLSLHTDIADPIKRLAAIVADTREMKAMQEGVVMNVLLDVVHNLPGSLVGAAAKAAPLLATRATSFTNTLVTNVPGPAQPIYMLGAKALQMFGSMPLLDGASVLHCVGSYNGEFMFTFVACPVALQDPDLYRDCIADAVAHVAASAAA